ncbi:MAG TPA: tetratricopeptide repeat protein [Kiritimatiellia bacterium]|nr:tetratricopeptide repeat protein [Kiritimatiellia bacterium]HMO97490.1 tetratricopeptide repeat protein [Kiritimatiellia bacterium]HMP96299.1 tetratricopeptide repeat protein [Kiritimatiellia bacterium]
MNNDETTHQEAPGKPAQVQQLEQHEVPEVLDFLKENAIAIVVGVLIAVVGFVGFTVWKNTRAAKIDTAASLLANSQTAPQFQEIINNYPDTPAAALAYLSLAGAYFDQGQFDLARQTFEQFKEKHPRHTMIAVAELGIAQSLESIGNLTEALSAYDRYLAQHANHFMAPSATFGKARVLEAMSRFDDAKAVYETFIAENPESRWTIRAETGLEFVRKQERAAQTAP